MLNKRFTLIELMIVTSIILILAAILMPALARVKRKAMTISCLNNIKQCSTGVTMMANANNNKFPYTNPPNSQREMQLRETAADDLRPKFEKYIDWNVWKCTFFNHLPNADSPLNTGKVFSHYFYFPGQDYYIKRGSTFYTSHKLDKNGASNVLMQDLVYWYGGSTPGYRFTHGEGTYTVPYSFCPSYAWYKAGNCRDANLAYADGHAEYIRFKDLDHIGTNSSNAKIYSKLP